MILAHEIQTYWDVNMLIRFLAVMLIGKTNALLLRSYTLQHFRTGICDFRIIYTSVIILPRTLNSCVTLGKVLNLSGPRFFHLLNKDENITVRY